MPSTLVLCGTWLQPILLLLLLSQLIKGMFITNQRVFLCKCLSVQNPLASVMGHTSRCCIYRMVIVTLWYNQSGLAILVADWMNPLNFGNKKVNKKQNNQQFFLIVTVLISNKSNFKTAQIFDIMGAFLCVHWLVETKAWKMLSSYRLIYEVHKFRYVDYDIFHEINCNDISFFVNLSHKWFLQLILLHQDIYISNSITCAAIACNGFHFCISMLFGQLIRKKMIIHNNIHLVLFWRQDATQQFPARFIGWSTYSSKAGVVVSFSKKHTDDF